MSRLAKPLGPLRFYPTDPKNFSNFDHVDDHYAPCAGTGAASIRRLLSLARARDGGYRTLIEEDVPPTGAVADEIEELRGLYRDYSCKGIRRLSFWRTIIRDEQELAVASPDDCLGWALLKHDQATIHHRPARHGEPARPARSVDLWHVFESVIVKYPHDHNYVPNAPVFHVQIGNRTALFAIPGWLYCQQNGLNKCCAQVAIRTLATAYLNDPDLTYRRINELAPERPNHPDDLPGDSLTGEQIETVFKGLNIHFDLIHYPNIENDGPLQDLHKDRPYHRYIYGGVEAGVGALLAFHQSGPRADRLGHIIPVFGHTFNEDTWAPRGDAAYFHVGERLRHISSESWMSSFLIHDDNFGSDFCLPKHFIPRRRVERLYILRPKGFAYDGIDAEATGSHLFSSLIPHLDESDHPWLRRLRAFVGDRDNSKGTRRCELILRTVPISREDYERELRRIRDRKDTAENPATIDKLRPWLKDHMWMIEVSIPDLFSTNLRKLGELLLAADVSIDSDNLARTFIFARLPRAYLLPVAAETTGRFKFSTVASALDSHTPLFRA